MCFLIVYILFHRLGKCPQSVKTQQILSFSYSFTGSDISEIQLKFIFCYSVSKLTGLRPQLIDHSVSARRHAKPVFINTRRHPQTRQRSASQTSSATPLLLSDSTMFGGALITICRNQLSCVMAPDVCLIVRYRLPSRPTDWLHQ